MIHIKTVIHIWITDCAHRRWLLIWNVWGTNCRTTTTWNLQSIYKVLKINRIYYSGRGLFVIFISQQMEAKLPLQMLPHRCRLARKCWSFHFPSPWIHSFWFNTTTSKLAIHFLIKYSNVWRRVIDIVIRLWQKRCYRNYDLTKTNGNRHYFFLSWLQHCLQRPRQNNALLHRKSH